MSKRTNQPKTVAGVLLCLWVGLAHAQDSFGWRLFKAADGMTESLTTAVALSLLALGLGTACARDPGVVDEAGLAVVRSE